MTASSRSTEPSAGDFSVGGSSASGLYRASRTGNVDVNIVLLEPVVLAIGVLSSGLLSIPRGCATYRERTISDWAVCTCPPGWARAGRHPDGLSGIRPAR